MTLLLSTSLPLRLPSSCTLLQRQSIRTFYCSNIDFEKKKEPSKKYSNTLLLPKTPFPMKVEGKRRMARDKEIFQHCNLDKQYAWQRENRFCEPKLNNLVEAMISAGPEPSMCSTMGLRMPMGRPILVMQSTKSSKILLEGERERITLSSFFSGFRVLGGVDCIGCQVGWVGIGGVWRSTVSFDRLGLPWSSY